MELKLGFPSSVRSPSGVLIVLYGIETYSQKASSGSLPVLIVLYGIETQIRQPAYFPGVMS